MMSAPIPYAWSKPGFCVGTSAKIQIIYEITSFLLGFYTLFNTQALISILIYNYTNFDFAQNYEKVSLFELIFL